MAAIRVNADNQARLTKMRRAIQALPIAERPMWLRRVGAKLRTGVPGAFRVAGGSTGEWVPEADADDVESEWDLELANWLDGSYQIVSDRVEQVARKGADAVASAGWSLWPLAIAVVAVALAVSSARGAAAPARRAA